MIGKYGNYYMYLYQHLLQLQEYESDERMLI